MTFDEQLLRSRIVLGLSQAEAAHALSVSRRTYQYWERQGGKPPHILMQEAALARLASLQEMVDQLDVTQNAVDLPAQPAQVLRQT